MKEKINILCTPDDNYIPYCGIMLTSLFENNKQEDIVVYIICDTLTEKNRNALDKLGKEYDRQINIIKTNTKDFEACPIRMEDHVSIAAYYRLLAPNLLPGHINKILYLDCDIIINGNIKNLYNSDISEYALGAVTDERVDRYEVWERLQYPVGAPYINSGVLLLNLDWWRKENASQKCMEYIKNNPEKVIFHDQDTLNAVLYKKIKLLPLTYNFQRGFLERKQIDRRQDIKDEILKCMYKPVIIHYTGYGKPWHRHSQHPYRERFLHYRKISLWKNTPIIGINTFKEELRYYLVNIIWALGIKKRPQTYIIEKQP